MRWSLSGSAVLEMARGKNQSTGKVLGVIIAKILEFNII